MINNPNNIKIVLTMEEFIKALEDKIKNNSDELIVFNEKSSVGNGISDLELLESSK